MSGAAAGALRWRGVAVATLLLVGAIPLVAQSGSLAPSQAVSPDDVLRLLERRPQTAADRAAVAVTAADRVTAQTLPHATISHGGVHLVSGLSTVATTQHQEQPLLWFHQVFKQRCEALVAFDVTAGDRVAMLRRMAEDALREGSADILELLDANRSSRDFQLARVQQLEAVKLAEELVISNAGLDAAEPPP